MLMDSLVTLVNIPFTKRIILDIQIILQKNLQTVDIVSNSW